MICFFGDDFSVIGGVETTTFNLQRELLITYGIKTDIFSLKKTKRSPEVFTVLPFNYRLKYLSIILAFIHLRKLGYNQIVTSYFAFNIINIIMSKFLGYRAIIQEHASSSAYSRSKLFFITALYRFSDEFIVLNTFDREFYTGKGLKPSIYMNCYSYKNNFTNITSRKYHLILSRIDDNKRIHLAIESFLLYKKMGGHYPLVVVGDGDSLITLKNKYASNDVKFIGSVREPNKYLSSARSLIITSKLECFPTVVIEGMFTGTPSIAFNVPSGLKDIIITGRDGVLVDDGRCDLIANALLQLDDEKRLEEMASEAYESSKKYSPKNSVEQYHNLFTRN